MELAPSMGVDLATRVSKRVWVVRLLVWGLAAFGMAEGGQLWLTCNTALVVELLLPLFVTQLKLLCILLRTYIPFRIQMLEYPHWQQSRQHVDYHDLLWEEVLTIVESLAIWVIITAVVLFKVRRSLEVRVLLLCLAIWVSSVTGIAEPFMILDMEDQQEVTNSTSSSRSTYTTGSSSGSSAGSASTEDDLHHWLLLHLHLLSVVTAALAAMAAKRWLARGSSGSSSSGGSAAARERGRARGAVGAGPRAGRRGAVGLAVAAAGAHRAVLDPQAVDLAGAADEGDEEQEQGEGEGAGAMGVLAESAQDQWAEGGCGAEGEEEAAVAEEDEEEEEDEQPGALGRRPGVGRTAGPSRTATWQPYMPMLRHTFTAVQLPGVWRPGRAVDGTDAEACGAGSGSSGAGAGRRRGLLRCVGAVVRRLVGGAPAVGYEARLRLLVERRTGQFLVAVHLHPGREELMLETVDAAAGASEAVAYGGSPAGGLRGEGVFVPAGPAWGQGAAAAARHGGAGGSAEPGWTGGAGMGRGRRGHVGGAGGGAARGLPGAVTEAQETAALGGPLTDEEVVREVVREVLLLRWWRPWAWVQWRLRLLLRAGRRYAGQRCGRPTEDSGAAPAVRVALAQPRVLLVPPGGCGAVEAAGEHVVARIDVTCADPSMKGLRPGCELHARQDGKRLPCSFVQLRSDVTENGMQQTVKLHFPHEVSAGGVSLQAGPVPGAEQARIRPGLVLLDPQVGTREVTHSSTAREASYGGADLVRQADQLGRLRRGVLLCVEDPGAAAELEEVLGPGRRGPAGAGSETGSAHKWAAVAARGLRVDLGVFVGQVRRLRDTVARAVQAERQAGAAGWQKSSWWLAELLAGRAGAGAEGGGGAGSRGLEGLSPCLACSVAHACELEPLPPHNLEVLGEHLLYYAAAAGLHRTAQYVARLMCDVQRALVLACAHRSCCAAAAATARAATGSGKDGAGCERGWRGSGGGAWLRGKVAAWKAQVEAHAEDTRCMRLHLHGFLGGGWVEALAAVLESHVYASAVGAATAAAAAATVGGDPDAGEHERAAAPTAAALPRLAARSSRRGVGSRLGRAGGERRSGVVQYRLQVVLPRLDPRAWWAPVGLVVGHVLTWLAGWLVRMQPDRAAWSHWAALQVARWAPVVVGACTDALAVAVMLGAARWVVPLREAGGGGRAGGAGAGEGRGKRKGQRVKGAGQGQGQGRGGGVASGVDWVWYAARVRDAGVGAVATCGVLLVERLWAGAAVGEVGVGRWLHAALRGALFGCLRNE